MRSFAIIMTAKQAVHKMRLREGTEAFNKQIAALTIQLAWRKYIRRKLLQSLNPNKRQLRMWDPELIAMKQRALVSQVYGEQIEAPFWHPNMFRPHRPYWAKLAPSSADQPAKKKGQLGMIKLHEDPLESKRYSYNLRH